MINKPKAIIFDWDNTLADTWGVIHASLNKTFEAMGHKPWSIDDVKSGKNGIHQSLRNSFPVIFGDEWERARKIYYENFLASHLEGIRKFPHAEEMLKYLSGTDINLSIVSNKTGPYLRKEVEHLGWGNIFSKVIGATDAEEDKPSPKPIYMALSGSGIEPGRHVWFIGDSETDIECALNSGCLPVFFGDGKFDKKYHSDERLRFPISHIKNHKELIDIIKKF